MNIEKIKLYQWFINQPNIALNMLKHTTNILNYLNKLNPEIKQIIDIDKNVWSINEFISTFNDNLRLYDIHNDLNLEFPNDRIQFSWHKDNYISTGHRMNVGSIKDLIFNTTINENPLYIKMSNCPYRMDNINFSTELWNNCVAIDIDYKNCYETYKIDPNDIYNNIVDYLGSNYNEIFLYSELSRSERGFHFIFNINSPKTIDGIKFAVIMSEVIITNAFIANNYGDIIYYPEVLDDCTKSIVQGIYFTGNKYFVNTECTGTYLSYYNQLKTTILNKISNDKWKDLEKLVFSSNNNNIELINNLSYDDIYEDISSIMIYKHIRRSFRWQCFIELYSILVKANIFTEENLKNLWDHLMTKMPVGKHNTKYYCNEPYVKDWNKKKTDTKFKYPGTLKSLGLFKYI